MRSIVVATAWFQDYLGSEESASGSRSEQQFVPDLLQIEDYAKALAVKS